MNERIRELAEQAGFIVDQSGHIMVCFTSDGNDEVKKFAESIIEECRNVVADVYRNTPLELCGPLLAADEEIAKHFYGIEE